ncbi:MAG TPA: helix-turn-helix domain-containing protein, partial [Solirubrobacterales bacterium]|nr:helix-turn-helix domain-containing protein [Solirubrobacterales bacterium]
LPCGQSTSPGASLRCEVFRRRATWQAPIEQDPGSSVRLCRSVGRTRTLDSHASRLRRKLDPEFGRYVVNCWGVGYRLVDAPETDDRAAA